MSDFPNPEPNEGTRPMEPISQARLSARQTQSRRRPLMTTSAEDEEAAEPLPEPEPLVIRPRAAHREADPIFTYLIIVSLGIGIAPLEPTVRYLFLWSMMGLFGVIAYLLGGITRMREAKLDDLFWGMAFGFVSSFPFLLVFGSALHTVSERMFDVEGTPNRVMDTWVFMAVAFVMPFAETLFFRGGMQQVRSIFLTTILATLWSMVLFFPHMQLGGSEAIGLVLMIVFVLLNFMYSYVRFRNGLAAAWLCQAMSYTLLWFFPRLLF